MKYGRVITVAVCAAALLAALCGCGDTPPEVSDPTTTASTTTTTAAETTTTTAETTVDTTTAATPKSTTKKPTTTTTTKKPTTTTTKVITTTTTVYTPRPKTPARLSAQQEAEIKDYWVSLYVDPEPEHTVDAVEIIYYGTYNGYVALMIKDNFWLHLASCREEEVAGVLFEYPSSICIWLWKNGEMLKLKTAYEKGILAQEDVRDIEYYYSGD